MQFCILSSVFNPLHEKSLTPDDLYDIICAHIHNISYVTSKELNAMVAAGEEKGVSLLWALSISKSGQITLSENNHMIDKISAKTLNSPVVIQPYKGTSALYWLTTTLIGRKILYDNISLFMKVIPAALSRVISCGLHEGKSPAWWLVSTKSGQSIFVRHPEIFHSISSSCLNTLSQYGAHRGTSVLFWLSTTSFGQRFLAMNHTLIHKINSTGLNSTTADNITSLFLLSKSIKGQHILSNEYLTSMVNQHALNSIIRNHYHHGLSALWMLASTRKGVKILSNMQYLGDMVHEKSFNYAPKYGINREISPLLLLSSFDEGQMLLFNTPSLIDKITIDGLNRIIAKGDKKGMSPLFMLTTTSLGMKILSTHKRLIPMIGKETINSSCRKPNGEISSALLQMIQYQNGGLLFTENPILYELFIFPQSGNCETNGRNTISFLTKTLQGQAVLRKHTSFYPKKQTIKLNIPNHVESELKKIIESDIHTNKIIVNPVKKNSRSHQYFEYEPLYWRILSEQVSDSDTCKTIIDPDQLIEIDHRMQVGIISQIASYLTVHISEILEQYVNSPQPVYTDFLAQLSQSLKSLDEAVVDAPKMAEHIKSSSFIDYLVNVPDDEKVRSHLEKSCLHRY